MEKVVLFRLNEGKGIDALELVSQQKVSPRLLRPLHFLPMPSFSFCFSLTIFHDDAISNCFLILCSGWNKLLGD